MTSGTLFMILALFSLAGLGICHKLADSFRCKPTAVNVMLFFWAGLVLWSYTVLYTRAYQQVSLFPPFTLKGVLLAAACGTCASIAILTFQIGIRYGRIATSWLVINLSTIVPALLSLVIYREWDRQMQWQQPVGLLLVLLSVGLLWKDKALEICLGEQPCPLPAAAEAAPERATARAS